MSNDHEVRQRILEAAKARFFAFGFTRVTMDALASEMGMSKKTLYAYFPSKHRLLQEIMKKRMEEIGRGVDRLVGDGSLDFGEKLKQMTAFLAAHLSQVGHVFLQDIRKNAPDVWKEMETFRREKALGTFGDLVDEGVRKGVFRQDLDRQLLVLIYADLIQTIISPDALSQLPLSASRAFESVVTVILEGILTDEARQKCDAHRRS